MTKAKIKNHATLGRFSTGDPENREAPVFLGDLVVGAVIRLVESENVAKRGGNSVYKHTVVGYSVELFGPRDAVELKTRAGGARVHPVSRPGRHRSRAFGLGARTSEGSRPLVSLRSHRGLTRRRKPPRRSTSAATTASKGHRS